MQEITLQEALAAINKIPLKKILVKNGRHDLCQFCEARGFPSEHAVLVEGENVGERRLIAHKKTCVWARLKRSAVLM